MRPLLTKPLQFTEPPAPNPTLRPVVVHLPRAGGPDEQRMRAMLDSIERPYDRVTVDREDFRADPTIMPGAYLYMDPFTALLWNAGIDEGHKRGLTGARLWRFRLHMLLGEGADAAAAAAQQVAAEPSS